MKLRLYLTRFLALACAFSACISVSHAEVSKPPMNIIFVLVDDLRFDGMGFLQPKINTPNIDRLAQQGVYFPNAVVTSSLCSPSRATILTGMTTRNHGVVDNNHSSEDGLTFFPKYLQQAGYQTGFFGKWHMGFAGDHPRPGFDRWVSFAGQGSYFPTDWIPPEQVEKGIVNQLNIDGQHVDQQKYITDELTDYALDWLQKGRDQSKPFFLYLSHKAVHSDALPPQRYENQYQKVDFQLPESAADTLQNREGKPMWVQNQRNSWHGIDFMYATDKKMTDYLRNYYAALSAVDDSLARLMQYLNDNGLRDSTMIIFYSDNGYMIGEHGLIDKRNAYEASVKVPLVISAPGLLPEGETNPVRVRNLDMAPTLLSAAGVKIPAHFEGKSFLPVASHEQSITQWGEPDFIYEYYWEWSFPMTPTTFAIQRGPLKYIQYHGVWDIEELYDLDKDPAEMHNLINEDAYFENLIELRRALFEQLANRRGQHSVPYHARTAAGANLRNKNNPGSAPFPAGWLTVPNRKDKYNGVFADTPMKHKYIQEGKFYFPYMENTDSAH